MKQKIRVTLTEEMLGTASSNPEIHDEFIASHAPDAMSRKEEVEALGVEEVTEKNVTRFPRVDNHPIVWDYQIKGFFKDACGMLNRVSGTESSKLTAYKKVIDGIIFVYPRAILIQMPVGGQMGECQRPLRAQTAQGERIALAHSESIPVGTVLEFEVEIMELKKDKKLLEACFTEWMDYGAKRGLGQWRNSGKGRFIWEKVK